MLVTRPVFIFAFIYVHGKSEFTWMHPIAIQYYMAYSGVLFSLLLPSSMVRNIVPIGFDMADL